MNKLSKYLSPKLQGGLLIVLAFIIIGPNDVLIPFVALESGLWQFHLCRSIIAIILIAFFIKITRSKVFIIDLRSIVLRTFFYVVSMVIYFGCLSFLPIAVTGAGMFTSPIFVLIFSYFIFKQHIGLKRIAAVIIGSIGVWVILNPTGLDFSLITLLPVLGGAFLAMGNMATWRLCANEDPLVLNCAFFAGIGFTGLIGVIFFSIYSFDNQGLLISDFFLKGWTNGTGFLWILIFIQALGSCIGIFLLTKAYQMADTSYLNIFEYSFLIFAGLSAWLILGQRLSLMTMFGIILIVIAGLIVSLAKESNKKLNKITT